MTGTRVGVSDERGFTIIELTVALGLLAIVSAALAPVFWSAIRTASIANHRTDGASIASREIEGMRAVPYAQVGFYQDQPGYVTSFEGFTTVSLGGSSPASGANVPEMQPLTPDPQAANNFAPDPDPTNAQAITQGNRSFSVKRYVVWVDAKDASTTYTQAYKRLTTIVTWTDVVGPHTVREDSVLYPGGQGPYGGPEGQGLATTSTTAPANPAPVTPSLDAVNQLADPQGETQLQVVWSQSGTGGTTTSFSVEYSTDPSFPVGNFTIVNNLASNVNSLTVTSLSPNTQYFFEVIAYGPGGSSSSAVKDGTTRPVPGPSCTPGVLIVAGATSKSTTGTYLSKNGKMTENLTLTFSTSGTCGAYFVVGTSPSLTTDPGSPYTLTQNGNTYTATIPSSGSKSWGVGLHRFTVWDSGTGSATTVVKSFQVCTSSATSC